MKTRTVKKVVRRVAADVRQAGRRIAVDGKVLLVRAKASLQRLRRKAAAGRAAWREQD